MAGSEIWPNRHQKFLIPVDSSNYEKTLAWMNYEISINADNGFVKGYLGYA